MEGLLDFALPQLQSLFQQQFETRVNLRLGWVETFAASSSPTLHIGFPPKGRAQDFPSTDSDWGHSGLDITRNSLIEFAYRQNTPVYLDPQNQFRLLLPLEQSVEMGRMAYPLVSSHEPHPGAILEVELFQIVTTSLSPELHEALELFGTALTNAHRFEYAQNKIHRMETIITNHDEVSGQPDLRQTLLTTVRRAMSLLQADGGTFYLADYEHQEAECLIDLNNNRDLTGIRMKFGEGIVGRVIVSGQPLSVSDYRVWEGRALELGDVNVKAIIGVPVIWQDEIIGALSVMNYEGQREFSQSDAQSLALFAEQAASAISLNRSLEATLRSKRELELLNQAAVLVNSNLEVPAICETLVSELADNFGYPCVFIYLREDDGKLRVQAIRGYDTYFVTVDENAGVCGRAVRLRQTQLVRDAALDPDFLATVPGISGGVYVPMMHGDELFGLMGVELTNPRTTQADQRLLESLSAHLTTAIRNAQLFREVDRQANQLQRRNQELEAVFAGLSEGLAIINYDEDKIKLQVNPEGLRLLGWGNRNPSPDELNDVSQYEVYLPVAGARAYYDRAEVPPVARQLRLEEWPISRVMRGEKFSGVELLCKGPDGQLRVISYAGSPLTNAEGKVVQGVIVCHDVTAIRAVEQMRDSFLSLVSHDLRTPLIAISGYAEQAQFGLEIGDEKGVATVRRSLQVITRHSERLNRLVSDLLDMARLESGRLRLDRHPYNLAPLLRNACHYILETMPDMVGWEYNPQHPKRPWFRLELDRTLPKVPLDQERFDQVLSNLLSNAVKYSDQGGEILISLITDPDDPHCARLEIRDQGIGIESEKLSRLFNQFYRTEIAEQGGFSGVGLGLYICRLMVEAHNGRIRAESAGPGQGSTFYVSLPFAVA